MSRSAGRLQICTFQVMLELRQRRRVSLLPTMSWLDAPRLTTGAPGLDQVAHCDCINLGHAGSGTPSPSTHSGAHAAKLRFSAAVMFFVRLTGQHPA